MKYSIKRVLAKIFLNAQSVRWATQGPIIKKFWKDEITSNNNALDIGCGGGTYAIEYFLSKGCQTTLVDYDKEMTNLAKTQVNLAFPACRLATYEHASAENLPFHDATFDRIQCCEVLEHLENPVRALTEMYRIGKPEALLVLSVPHPPEWHKNPAHVVDGYTLPELTQIFEKAGWVITSHGYCMLFLTRIICYLAYFIKFPLPLIPICQVEGLVPDHKRRFFLPYNIVVKARKITS